MDRPLGTFLFHPSSGAFSRQSVAKPINVPTGSIVMYGTQMYDIILFLFTCKTHQKVVLKKTAKKGAFDVPFYPLKLCGSWQNQISYYLEQLLKNVQVKPKAFSSELLQVNVIRLLRHSESLLQLVVAIEMDGCNGSQCDALSNSSFKWFPIDKVSANDADFASPEPCRYLNRGDSKVRMFELSLARVLKANSRRWSMATAIGYTKEDVVRLFANFLQHSFPSLSMNESLFADFLERSGIKLAVLSKVANGKRLFNSFCGHTGVYVSFKDFLLTLVALDRRCLHGGIGGELRTRCLFRFYAKRGSTGISYNELLNLYVDTLAFGKAKEEKGAPEPELETVVFELFKKEGLNRDTQSISMEKFVELVGNLVIRGTSSVYRSTTSPLQEIRSKSLYNTEIWAQEVKVQRLLDSKGLLQTSKLCQKLCLACDDAAYRLAIHSLAVQLPHCGVHYFLELPSELPAKYPKAIRERSLEAQRPEKVYNLVRNVLRRFSAEMHAFPLLAADSPSASNSLPRWERKADRSKLVEKILRICLDAKEVFLKEPRVARVSSPCYVFGDVHGNFRDLMLYDHFFWRQAPLGLVPNCLLLGDYVDRGEHSVECTLYLLVMKLLVPERIILTRGNHEIRSVQQMFTFYRECVDKFGPRGMLLWETFNQVFDTMPLACIIDQEIFTAHGGIPCSVNRCEELSTIPVPLADPNCSKGGNKAAWEMLWNDPISQNEYRVFNGPPPIGNYFPILPAGFLPNSKRGTAFLYSDDAADAFFELNDLGYVIRGHELIENGFRFDGQTTLTIFSCSNYCGSGNEAAVVFVEDAKIRVIKLETFEKFDS